MHQQALGFLNPKVRQVFPDRHPGLLRENPVQVAYVHPGRPGDVLRGDAHHIVRFNIIQRLAHMLIVTVPPAVPEIDRRGDPADDRAESKGRLQVTRFRREGGECLQVPQGGQDDRARIFKLNAAAMLFHQVPALGKLLGDLCQPVSADSTEAG